MDHFLTIVSFVDSRRGHPHNTLQHTQLETASNALSAQSRVRKAFTAAGLQAGSDRRQLFLLRNTPWPTGPKTAELMADVHAAGARTVELGDDDLRTMIALRDLINDDHHDLPGWLRRNRPAHGLTLLRHALGGEADTPAPPAEEAGPEVEEAGPGLWLFTSWWPRGGKRA